MNKCIAFFIVLVLALFVAVLTDKTNGNLQEEQLVGHKNDTNSVLVDNKTMRKRRY